jgi:tetratricopeptide (TPR) repeat protein
MLHEREAFEEGFLTFLQQAKLQSEVTLLVVTGCRFGDEFSPNYAIQCFEAALDLVPHHASAWYNKGVSLHLMCEEDQALAAYERALQLDRDHHLARYYAGTLLYMTGHHREAFFHWEKLMGRTDTGAVGEALKLIGSVLKEGLPLEPFLPSLSKPKYMG